jgi:hypothetical protein
LHEIHNVPLPSPPMEYLMLMNIRATLCHSKYGCLGLA